MQKSRSTRTQHNIGNTKQANNNDYGYSRVIVEKNTEGSKKTFWVTDIPHNLIAACELVNAGCSVHLYQHECEIEYEGGTLYPGWRDKPSRLRIMGLNYEGENIITPYTAPE